MRAWLTVDSPGEVVCRAISIPEQFIPHVLGALGELCDPTNWEEHGDLTVEECVEYMSVVWESFGECP